MPSTASALATLAGVTLRRLSRSRALWVLLAISLLPAFIASFLHGHTTIFDLVATTQLIVTALLASVFVASAIGEEIEDRTTTYLWSRPIARWTIVAGKVIALAPICGLLAAGGWAVAMKWTNSPLELRTTLAFASGGIALSFVAAGIALLVPKHGMALSIIYLLLVDLVIGGIPASLQSISITHQVWLLARTDPGIANPAITMVVIAVLWLGVGLLRLRRLES
ncbi:MAG TPA: ABC transporter permease subunit [Kofleriaceae bacterium]|nr:ABC transporter permease subunit [Kofleriaceae bacterium]